MMSKWNFFITLLTEINLSPDNYFVLNWNPNVNHIILSIEGNYFKGVYDEMHLSIYVL